MTHPTNNKPKKTWVEVSAKYFCTGCVNTFYRKNRGWFSVNPLQVEDYNVARHKLEIEQAKRIRACPKCKADVKPL